MEFQKALKEAGIEHKKEIGSFKPLQPQTYYIIYVIDPHAKTAGNTLFIYDANLKDTDSAVYDFIHYFEEDLFKDTLDRLDREMTVYFQSS